MKTRNAAISVLFALCSQSVQAVTISVSDMVESEWFSVPVSNEGVSGTLQLTAPDIGGASGTIWQNTFQVANQNVGSNRIRMANIFSGAHYNPSTQGAITSMTFSYGTIRLVSVFANGSAGFLVPSLMQGGQIFAMTVGAVAESNPVWHNSQIDTSLVNDWAVFGTSIHPDFGASGADIQFGYLVSMGAICAGSFCRGGTISSGLDNFRVDITSDAPVTTEVPEPSTALLTFLGLGAVGWSAQRSAVWRKSVAPFAAFGVIRRDHIRRIMATLNPPYGPGARHCCWPL